MFRWTWKLQRTVRVCVYVYVSGYRRFTRWKRQSDMLRTKKGRRKITWHVVSWDAENTFGKSLFSADQWMTKNVTKGRRWLFSCEFWNNYCTTFACEKYNAKNRWNYKSISEESFSRRFLKEILPAICIAFFIPPLDPFDLPDLVPFILMVKRN